MIRYFLNRFAMTQAGAKDLVIAIFSHIVFDIALILPAVFALMYIHQVLEAESVTSIWYYLLAAVIMFAMMYVAAKVDYKMLYTKTYTEAAERRINLAEKLRLLPLAFFSKKDVSDLSSTIMDDTTELETLFSHAVPQLYAAIINSILLTFGLFFLDWPLALATVWVIPVAYLVFRLSKRAQQAINRKLYQQKRDVSEVMQEGFDQYSELYAYNREEDYLAQFDQRINAYEKTLIRSELLIGSVLNLSHALLKLGIPSIVLVGAYRYFADDITLFTYLIFIIVSVRIYQPIEAMIDYFAALNMLDVRVDRMREMQDLPTQTGSENFDPKGYDIVFDDVSFSYEKDQNTLQNLSFTAKQGEVTALVGPSGGGKSTVTKIAARFWDIDSGKITIGGVDISTIDPEALLRHISIVFQDVALFDASIAENIRLGRKGASDEEVFAAAKVAGCDEFVSRLPQGYDTAIGENGARLSGGERQRISIARAILKDAPIILLDEATASVDVENESKIQAALSELIADKTVLIIAHRMRTVTGVDHIIVLSEGKLVEQGSPQQLKDAGGHFAGLLARQQDSGF
ncbi:MAG: ABC transporter ATP-binding protein [Actinomycetaceae bacterium]|nr:ABC transporter ATP-binding protein [Actinomycetaceae bacterium]